MSVRIIFVELLAQNDLTKKTNTPAYRVDYGLSTCSRYTYYINFPLYVVDVSCSLFKGIINVAI